MWKGILTQSCVLLEFLVEQLQHESKLMICTDSLTSNYTAFIQHYAISVWITSTWLSSDLSRSNVKLVCKVCHIEWLWDIKNMTRTLNQNMKMLHSQHWRWLSLFALQTIRKCCIHNTGDWLSLSALQTIRKTIWKWMLEHKYDSI